MAGIQNNVIERGKRNVVSRVFHSKTDKDAIAAWRQDLNRILQIFTVRPINRIWQSLIHHSQAELLMNTHLTVADTHLTVQDTHSTVKDTHSTVKDTHSTVKDTHLTVKDTHLTVADTHSMVADIHRNVLAVHASSDGQNLPVSTGLCPPITEH